MFDSQEVKPTHSDRRTKTLYLISPILLSSHQGCRYYWLAERHKRQSSTTDNNETRTDISQMFCRPIRYDSILDSQIVTIEGVGLIHLAWRNFIRMPNGFLCRLWIYQQASSSTLLTSSRITYSLSLNISFSKSGTVKKQDGEHRYWAIRPVGWAVS